MPILPNKLRWASLRISERRDHSTTSTLHDPWTSIISSEEKAASTETPLPAFPTLIRAVCAK